MANLPDHICACGVSYSPLYVEQPYCSIICPSFLSEIRVAFARIEAVGDAVAHERACAKGEN